MRDVTIQISCNVLILYVNISWYRLKSISEIKSWTVSRYWLEVTCQFALGLHHIVLNWSEAKMWKFQTGWKQKSSFCLQFESFKLTRSSLSSEATTVKSKYLCGDFLDWQSWLTTGLRRRDQTASHQLAFFLTGFPPPSERQNIFSLHPPRLPGNETPAACVWCRPVRSRDAVTTDGAAGSI